MSCALELAAIRAEGATEAKKAVVEAIKRVSDKLGNTPAVCKKSYIHPGVIDEFLANGALELIEKAVEKADPHALSSHESAVVTLVEHIVARENQPLGDLLAKSVRSEAAKRGKPAGRTKKRAKAA
jgi:DNA topoisomerase-1